MSKVVKLGNVSMRLDGNLLQLTAKLDKPLRETDKSAILFELGSGSFVDKKVMEELGLSENFWLSNFRLGWKTKAGECPAFTPAKEQPKKSAKGEDGK